MIKLLKDHYPRAQMVIMSGTLSNPMDLANYIGVWASLNFHEFVSNPQPLGFNRVTSVTPPLL